MLNISSLSLKKNTILCSVGSVSPSWYRQGEGILSPVPLGESDANVGGSPHSPCALRTQVQQLFLAMCECACGTQRCLVLPIFLLPP